MAAPELERMWRDRGNWIVPGIYYAKADPRVIVPKWWRWTGWTLNFAHRSAWLVLIGMIAVAVGPVLIVSALVRFDGVTLLACLVPSILLICLVCAWESERRR